MSQMSADEIEEHECHPEGALATEGSRFVNKYRITIAKMSSPFTHFERILRRRPTSVGLAILTIALAVSVSVFTRSASLAAESGDKKNAAVSQAAFLEVYKVLMHPRCMNCHPNGDQPLQGEDSHIHTMNVKRGDTGTGKFALKCGNC